MPSRRLFPSSRKIPGLAGSSSEMVLIEAVPWYIKFLKWHNGSVHLGLFCNASRVDRHYLPHMFEIIMDYCRINITGAELWSLISAYLLEHCQRNSKFLENVLKDMHWHVNSLFSERSKRIPSLCCVLFLTELVKMWHQSKSCSLYLTVFQRIVYCALWTKNKLFSDK